MHTSKMRFLLLPFLLLSFYTCTPDIKAPKPTPGNANFTRSIALGGDYMAGYQDGALYLSGQQHAIPALMAQKFADVGGTGFYQALMPDNQGLGLNPKPWLGAFITASHLGYKADCKGVVSLFPLADSLPLSKAGPYLAGTSGNVIQNLAVPFATSSQMLSPALGASFYSGNRNPFYNRIASHVGVSTVLSDARDQNATFFSAWLGMEEIFNYASNGGYKMTIPSSTAFAATLDTILSTLTAKGAKGVLATIPDFRAFPFYTLVPYNGAALTSQKQADSLTNLWVTTGYPNIQFGLGNNGFVIVDPTASSGFRQLRAGEFITLGVPLDSMKCHYMGVIGSTLHDRYVLDSTEVALIDQRISAYNAVIMQKANQYGLAVVDMHAYFNSVTAGIKWDGADFNGSFVTGGFFGLDGYHPNQKGYMLLANEFIKAINQKYSSTIATVNCPDCNGVLFP